MRAGLTQGQRTGAGALQSPGQVAPRAAAAAERVRRCAGDLRPNSTHPARHGQGGGEVSGGTRRRRSLKAGPDPGAAGWGLSQCCCWRLQLLQQARRGLPTGVRVVTAASQLKGPASRRPAGLARRDVHTTADGGSFNATEWFSESCTLPVETSARLCQRHCHASCRR